MPGTIFELQADLCRALGNATRLRIVHHLGEGTHTVGDIAATMNLAQSQVSQHLAILRAYGVVAARRSGQRTIYRIANRKIVRVCDIMREVLADQAAERSGMVEAMRED